MSSRINYNFTEARGIVLTGAARASAFMGIGINSTFASPPISHVLKERCRFSFIPDDIENEKRNELVSEYRDWIISNGLREMTEALSTFLVKTYAHTKALSENFTTAAQYRRAIGFIEKKGISNQLRILFSLLGRNNEFGRMFHSLNKARNCLAHRHGIVGSEDVEAHTSTFVLEWISEGALLDDGTNLLEAAAHDELVIAEGQEIFTGPVIRTKEFRKGEKLRLETHELAEICFGCCLATDTILHYTSKFMIDFGQDIPVHPAPTVHHHFYRHE